MQNAKMSRFQNKRRRNVYLCLTVVICLGLLLAAFRTHISYVLDIRKCESSGYQRGLFMTGCEALPVEHYSYDSLYTGIQKNALQNLQDADVLILGNSRTRGGFATDEFRTYFSEKGLKPFILVEDGVGVRTPTIVLDAVDISPKILLLSSENFQYTGSSVGFDEMLKDTTKSKREFRAFYFAQTFQSKICSTPDSFFYDWMCNGNSKSDWRSFVDGHLPWDKIGDPESEKLVTARKDSRAQILGDVVSKGEAFLSNDHLKNTCTILYLVTTPASLPELLNKTARELELQSSYVAVPNLYSYDNSHLDRPNSEKWAKAIIPSLDPQIDNCLAGKARIPKSPFDLANENYRGVSDYETWNAKLGATVTNQTASAPTGSNKADTISFTKRAGRLQKLFKEKPIKAGDSLTFKGWLWSPDYANIRVQILRACSAKRPMESTGVAFTLTPDPQSISVSHVFEHDQDCAMVQIMGLSENASIGAWNYQLTHERSP